ncbi:MAG: hypothetical protein JNL28_05905 [Planctomycetes bacterium]|nr:hypothetical protein [Planctomycetota bacterium]
MIIGSLFLALLHFTPALAQDPAPESRIKNVDQRGLQLALARLATERPALVTVLPVGLSRQGRRIEALRIAAGELTPGRPGVLLVANIDGPAVWTSALALDHARELTARYSSDERVKALLDSTTVYIIPRVDVDAAEARFAAPLHEVVASGPGVDDDRDGLQGEDPPADIDGDGRILWMRVFDPKGEWLPDPLDPRATIKADRAKGQRGVFKLVREGRDADKDGEASEDELLDTVLNRNFPQGWVEHAKDSGRFATEEPGARALCEFLLLHKDIALVMTYGALDNVVEKPKAEAKQARMSTNPADGIPESDVAIYAEFGRRFGATGRGVKGEGKDVGTFQAWVQAQRGLWTVNVRPWSLPLEESKPKKESKEGDDAGPAKKGAEQEKPSDEVKRLHWLDAHGEGARFVPWKPFAHPELGQVEIGGFAPYALIEPPDSERDEIANKNFDYLVELAGLLPRVKLVDTRAKDLGDGLWNVECVLVNDSMLPLSSALAQRTRAVRPARVTLALPQGAQLLAGNVQELVSELAGSGGRKELRWLVRGKEPSAIRVLVDTDHAGAVSAVPEVK